MVRYGMHVVSFVSWLVTISQKTIVLSLHDYICTVIHLCTLHFENTAIIIEGKTWELLQLLIKQLPSGFSALSQVSEKGWFTDGKTLTEILVHAHADTMYISLHTLRFLNYIIMSLYKPKEYCSCNYLWQYTAKGDQSLNYRHWRLWSSLHVWCRMKSILLRCLLCAVLGCLSIDLSFAL